MAEISKQALKVDNNQSFPNNNNGAITPSILRAFNTNMIDSMVDEISYNVDSASWNQQIDSLEGFTSSAAVSITNLNASSASQQISINNLNTFTASAAGLSTGSLLVTASAVSNVITFTKGDASTFDVTVADTTNLTPLNSFTASAQVSLNNLNLWTSSYQPVIVNLQTSQSIDNTKWNTLGGQTGSFVTETESGSFLITASVNLNTITFTKGNNTTFAITVNTGSAGGTTDISSLNAFTASQNTKNSTLATYTASVDTKFIAVGASTSSLNSATASLFTSASLALVTASFDNGTRNLTFTKGNTTQFSVNIPDASGSAGTTIFEVVYTGESITKGDPLYISGSQGANPIVFKADASNPAKMPVTFVSNETIGAANTTNAIVLGLIEGINLTGYTAGQAIYVAEGGGWSASLPSGSNSVTQLLGVVTKGGSGGKGLVLNPGPAQLPGLDTGKMWVGNGNNQPIEITTASFASSASFNSYTSSTNSRLTNIEAATSSYVTSAITASSLVTASVNLNTITFTKGDASTFNITVNTGSGGGGTINTGSFATTGSNTFVGDQIISGGQNHLYTSIDNGTQLMFGGSENGQAFDMRVTSSFASQQQTWLIENQGGIWGNAFFGRMYVDSPLNVNQTFTASLQEGYVWVGNATGKTTTVATSSFSGGGALPSGLLSSSVTNFVDYSASVDARILAITGSGGTINTGSFATTGSNTFTGDQTLIDAAGNTVTLSDTSGSLMLVAKTFTSASAHLSGSTNTQVNLIFKNNNNTADTIISGSNNIFVNPAAPTAGFKRYIGQGGNIILNSQNVPQISGSMQFSPFMTNNYFGGNGTTITMRGPVSPISTFSVFSNNILGTVNIGSSAANNAEKVVNGLQMANNSINGTLNFIANQNSLTSSVTTNNNQLGGNTTLTLNSSSVTFSNNTVLDSGFTWTNNYYTGSAGQGLSTANRNIIIGQSNSILTTGILDEAATTNQPNYINNLIAGVANQIFTNATSASANHSLSSTIIYGNTLIVSASSATAGATVGSAFFGRYGINDGVRNRTSDTIFSVGTGTGTGARKTGFLIDSGSNTFVEGTLNVSGSSSFTGSVYGNVVSMSVTSNTASMDLSLGNYFELTSSASPLRIELSNIKAGLTSTLIVSSSVSTSIAFSSNVGQPSPGAYSGSAAASTDILSFVAFNNSKVNVVATKNIL